MEPAVFGVWLGRISVRTPCPFSRSTPADHVPRRCTKMHFGENQLLRCLSRLLLLSTAHPMIFHHQRVRTSTACYGRFILAMDRSHLFGSDPHDLCRAIRTRFRFGSGPEALNLAVQINSRAHYTKGTRSPVPARRPA